MGGVDTWNSYLLFHAPVDLITHFTDDIVLQAKELATEIIFKGNPLLIFSACETGKIEIVEGDEFFGLVRGLILAGCPSIILSNWTLFDDSTKDLMIAFYEELLSGKSVGIALRNARKRLLNYIRNKKYDFGESQTIEFLHWASFTLYGNPFKKLRTE
jgi:CHAT domain-containing protein